MMTTQELDRAVEAADLVHAFKSYGLTQVDIATASGVDPKTVYAWKTETRRPRAYTYERLDGLREVIRVLADSLTERGVGQWLHARNRLMGGARPLDALRGGKQREVLEAAHAFIDGAYL